MEQITKEAEEPYNPEEDLERIKKVCEENGYKVSTFLVRSAIERISIEYI